MQARPILTFYNLNPTGEVVCQMFSKMAPTPPEKPLHQQSRSRSCFWRSRSPAGGFGSGSTSGSRWSPPKRSILQRLRVWSCPGAPRGFRRGGEATILWLHPTPPLFSHRCPRVAPAAVATAGGRRLRDRGGRQERRKGKRRGRWQHLGFASAPSIRAAVHRFVPPESETGGAGEGAGGGEPAGGGAGRRGEPTGGVLVQGPTKVGGGRRKEARRGS
jgi:hypothetical protein